MGCVCVCGVGYVWVWVEWVCVRVCGVGYVCMCVGGGVGNTVIRGKLTYRPNSQLVHTLLLQ